MARRTKLYQKIPWTGGVNTSVDSGLLNDNDLVTADNVIFTTSGSRLKREGLQYFDSAVPTPDSRSSSGTTRSLYFTTSELVVSSPATDAKLVAGEKINVTTTATSGNETSYAVSDTAIDSVTGVAEVTDVTCVADSAGSLNNKYFYINAGANGAGYYVWLNVSSGGTDPAIAGRTGIEVAISTGDAASTIASAIQAAVDAEDAFGASVASDTVTITNATTGYAVDATDAGTTGFTITVTTQGGYRVDYTASATLSESETSTTTCTVARASSIIGLQDYWRLDSSSNKSQLLIAATDGFKLFKYDTNGRRAEIEAEVEVFTVECGAASTLQASGAGDYITCATANDDATYYVWFDVDSGNSDPAPGGGRTGVEVDVASSDTASQVATKLQTALDALAGFTATVDTDTVTVTNVASGNATDAADVNTGFTVAVTTQGATLPDSTVSKVSGIVFNNRSIWCFDTLNDKPIKYKPEDSAKYQILGGSPPDCSFMVEYQGRLWANDKTDPDRIHYSSTGDHEEWSGVGDSGALDFPKGDGDFKGITNIFPYKGILFVQKAGRTFRVLGTTPESYKIEHVSDGIGGEGDKATVAVDQDDVVFVSKRGFHSIAATSAYGDTQNAFVSKKIQPSFNDWNQARLGYIQGAYVPELNSIAFAVSQDNSYNDTVWLFNTEIKEWYRWPDIECEALTKRKSNNTNKLVFGTRDSRIIQAQRGSYTDYSDTGIIYRIKSGTIYPGGNPQSVKAFKKLSLIYRPKGDFLFTVKVKIDNHDTQTLTFQQEAAGARLDDDFVLGESILGISNTLAPFTQQIDGYGRGLTLEVVQSGTEEQVEIYGFIIEFEEVDVNQETLSSDEV